LSGTAIALPGKNTVDSGDIKNGQVKGKDIGRNAVTGAKVKNGALTGAEARDNSLTGADIIESSLGQVPSAAHAGSADAATNARHAGSADTATNAAHASNSDQLGGSPPSAFFAASKVKTFNEKLAFGQTQTLFSAGTLTFSAKCVQNATDPDGGLASDFVALLVATSQDGGILTNGKGVGLSGTGPTDFLNTDTTEAASAVAWVSTTSGNSYGAIENNASGYGMQVVDPNGVAVIFPDGLTGAVNLFGTDCLMAGFAIIP
jgi:hypothetical protein